MSISVGSKTGTPQTWNLPNSAFIAFAPAEDPEIAVAVLIEKGWHGFTGAPVARDVFDHYFGFAPSQSVSQPAPEESADDAGTGELTHDGGQ